MSNLTFAPDDFKHGPIDAVMTWVDGADQEHQAKRARFAMPLTPSVSAIAPTRFADSGELWYSLRLLRRNAPWVRKIFLVTDNQKPVWLDDHTALALNVEIIDHTCIFRDFEDCLPTFSSRSIEAMLWRIPGLSEQFLYLNDDFFVAKSTIPTDYFINEKPVLRGRWSFKNRIVAYADRMLIMAGKNRKACHGLVGLRAESNFFSGLRFFRMAHVPVAVLKSELAACFSSETDLKSTINYRFRHPDQMWVIAFYANRLLRLGKAIVGEMDWAYLSPESFKGGLLTLQELVEYTEQARHLCIQSLDCLSEASREVCFELLNQIVSGDTTCAN